MVFYYYVGISIPRGIQTGLVLIAAIQIGTAKEWDEHQSLPFLDRYGSYNGNILAPDRLANRSCPQWSWGVEYTRKRSVLRLLIR